MPAEEEPPAGLADFSHLPADALGTVFQHLFAPSPSDGAAGVPLSEFLARWHAVRSTCRHWAEVLLASPPPLHLDISTMPEAWVHWLVKLPVRALRIEQGLDVRWSPPANGADQLPDGGGGSGGGSGPPAGMPAPLSAAQLVAGLEGTGLPQPYWSLAAFTRLQRLHLQAPISTPQAPAVFDAAAVEGLGQLTRLSLGSFADFCLDRLPDGLRQLRLGYDQQIRRLSVPALPNHISLDLLQLEKPGALGLCIDDFWGRVIELRIRAREVLLGVPVDDPRLIATFERPYREGNFVPPHIWGDEEADDNSKHAAEMAANHFLACLPSCSKLQRLCLAGGASAAPRFMPVLPHARDSLVWLWSVVRMQGLQNLFGLSGQEMEGRQQLFDDRLVFKHSQQQCCIEVVRDEVAGGGQLAPAGP